MAKETFGGDDEEAPQEETKKPKLDKFGLAPDVNIRDVFWRIMARYAEGKGPGEDLALLEAERFTLMRIALSVLSRNQSHGYGLSPREVVVYTFAMMLDAGWQDAMVEFIDNVYRTDPKALRHALRYALSEAKYREMITERFRRMLRDPAFVAIAAAVLADVGDKAIANALKKELVILARGDIGDNQLNAIKLLSLIREDSEARNSLVMLLSHWDENARLAAAHGLVGLKDEEVKKAAAQRTEKEASDKVLKVLRRILI